MDTSEYITVVIADDHTIWRRGVAADLTDPFRVVGEAGNAKDAIELAKKLHPTIVLCDLQMPDGGGLAVAKASSQDSKIVMLTASEAERDLLDAIAAGAIGYLLKSTSPEALRNALLKAASGEPVFSPALASLVLGEFRRLAKGPGDSNPLSEREREVLRFVARGHTYKEIGKELFIAEKTVENHVRNILGKLQLSRKQELIRYASDHKID